MSIKNLFRMESETVTEQPVRIPFSFDNKESVPKDRTIGDCIVVTPITVRTWFRMRPLLMEIDKTDLDAIIVKKGDVTADGVELLDKYGDILLNVICLGLHNKPTDPPEWFRKVLADNCTWEDMRILLNAILYRVGYHPFYESITLMERVSPIGEPELIAARKNQESWQQ